jgi:hypothetical protein
MTPLIVMYCLECEWDAPGRDRPQTELEVLTLEHELITGHEIASVWLQQDRDRQRQVASSFWNRHEDEPPEDTLNSES